MTPAWTTQSLSIRGLNKLRCQDATWAGIVGPYAVLVVADGVGGYVWSDLAAQAAVIIAQAVAAEASIHSPDRPSFADKIAHGVRLNWNEWHLAQIESDGIKKTDCTIAIAVVDTEGVSVRSVGDCVVILGSQGMEPCAVITPSRDEFGNVETLTHYCKGAANLEALEVDDPELSEVLISTDGIERVLHHGTVHKNGKAFTVTDLLDPYVRELLDHIRVTHDVGFLARELAAGLIHAQGSKGDDIGVAVAIR